ncbi:MAG: hypothetical protein ABMA64_22070 [Myxococcota bacterium]
MIGWLGVAAAAVPEGRCDPLPGSVVDRWLLAQDGRDVRGTNPASPAHGVAWELTNGVVPPTSVFAHLEGEAAFIVTDLELPDAFTLEGTFRPRGDEVATALFDLRWADGRSLELWLLDHHTVRIVDQDGRRHERAFHLDRTEGRLGFARGDDGRLFLLVDGALVEVDVGEGTGRGVARLTVGGQTRPGARLGVRDVVLHAAVDPERPIGAHPWCVPSARDDARPEPDSAAGIELEMDGYFLGFMGRYDGDPWRARQRLVLAPTVRLSRFTRVVLVARTLETKSMHPSGSVLRPADPLLSARGEFGVTVEQGYLARYVGEWRILPFYFAAGRVPLNFGFGAFDRNPMARIGAAPTSMAALLDGVQAGELANHNPELWGDASFGSTLDGGMLFFGNPPARQRTGTSRGLLGLRWGRRNPWCASWSDLGCPADLRGVYELVATGVLEQQLSTGPLSGSDALLLQGEIGARSGDSAFAPAPFARAAVAYTLPRAFPVWFDASFDGTLDWGVPEEDAAPELAASMIGAWAHGDLAFRAAPWFTLSADAGVTGGLDDKPVRGLHPDADFDLVLFSLVVADGSATSDALAPSLGGVVNAVFGRAGGAVRIGTRSGIEVPWFVTRAWALTDVPGVMSTDGALGSELDLGVRLNTRDWRLGAEVGVLFPGQGLVGADDPHPVAWELRIGRNL